MNIIQKIGAKILGIKALPAPTGTMNPYGLPGRYEMVNGTITWISDKPQAYITDGYQANDIVYSAVMMVMDKVRLAPWAIYTVVDESSLKRYQGLISGSPNTTDYSEAQRLRKKALEPMTSFNNRLGKVNDLLKWPNDRGTWNDLVAEGCGYKMITGNNMLWANILDAGANQGIPQELFNLPSQYIALIITRAFPQRVVGYALNHQGVANFAPETVLHEKYWNPSYSVNGLGLYGQSPIKAGIKTLTRNNSAKKAGSVQFDNNGTPGIAYVDDPIIPATGRDAQATAVKRVMANEYSGADNFGKVAFSGYKMGYTPIGSTLKDMDLTGVEATDLRGILNLWGLSSQLFNDPANKTYNNQREAEKALTSRAALPHLTSRRDNFNRKLQTDWGFKGVNMYVDFDMAVYTELQEDQAAKWGWVKDLPITSKGKLDLMGIEAPDDPNLNVILVNNMQIPLQDLVNGLSDTQMQQINDNLNKAGLNDYLRVAK